MPGRGTLQEQKGSPFWDYNEKKKKGKELYFFPWLVYFGINFKFISELWQWYRVSYVFHSASCDMIILCGHGAFIKANHTMLLTNVWSLFKCYQFFTNVFFSIPGSTQGSTLHFVVISPQFHSICGTFSVFPCLS